MTDTPEDKQGEGSAFGTLLLKRVLWFGVGFVVGLAPFLGSLKIAGFSALLAMYPFEMQNWLIPVSGLLMGVIALSAEYAYERGVADNTVDRWFKRTIGTFVVSLLLLLVLYVLTVTRVGENPTFATVTGTKEVPGRPGCTCEPGAPSEECVGKSLDPANTRRCFGATRVALATLALALVYFTLTGTLAAGVGLLVIVQQQKNEDKPKKKTTKKKKPG